MNIRIQISEKPSNFLAQNSLVLSISTLNPWKGWGLRRETAHGEDIFSKGLGLDGQGGRVVDGAADAHEGEGHRVPFHETHVGEVAAGHPDTRAQLDVAEGTQH